jgi:ribonuclease VapC
MIVDASAVLAILLEEEEGDAMEDILLLSRNKVHAISPVNYLEAAIRLDNFGDGRKGAELDPLLDGLGVVVVPLAKDEAQTAREAYQRYGKGNHPAKLNLGDCFAYALAKARGEPLLFKGDDFRLTDVEAAF